MRRIATMYALGLGVVGPAGCFDGRDAFGLPCEKDFQCGNGQVCAEGFCAWPGGAGTTGGSATSSSTATSVGSLSTGPDGPGTTSTSSGTSQATTTGSDSSSESTTTGGPDPIEGCSPGAVLRSRDIELPEPEGPPAAVGVGRFTASGADVVIVTSDPGRVLVYSLEPRGEFMLRDWVPLPNRGVDLAIGDVDNDGSDDLVVALDNLVGGAAGRVYWGSGDEDLFDAPTDFPPGLPPSFSVDIGELFDGGATSGTEILVSGGGDENGATLITVDTRSLTIDSEYMGVSSTPWDTLVADVDGDPPAEAIVLGSNSDASDLPGSDVVHVLRHEMGTLSPIATDASFQNPFGVDAGDLNRSEDGMLELVVVGKNLPAGPSEIGICTFEDGAGEPDCQMWEVDTPGFNNVRLGDINCDGDLDAIIGTAGVPNPEDGDVLIAMGPLEQDFVPQPLDDTPTGAVANRIAIASVTDDTDPDIIVPLTVPNGAGVSVVRVFSFEVP